MKKDKWIVYGEYGGSFTNLSEARKCAKLASIEEDYGDFDLKRVEQVDDTDLLILYISKYKECDCYRTQKMRRYLTEYEKGFYTSLYGKTPVDYIVEDQPYCMGTKEREICTCGGDKRKCDFYPTK